MTILLAASQATQAKPRSAAYRARRIHRWLGVFIGIQFLLWTAGGLYFSWTSLGAVHGDHLMRPRSHVPAGASVVSPATVVASLREREAIDSLMTMELTMVLDRPAWRIAYLASADGRATRRNVIADAATGELRAPLTRDEAVATARASYTGDGHVVSVDYLTRENVGRHHEYREQPLPAWAVRFSGEERPTAYVAAELGQVIRIRNDQWRAFDFLWMLHTMDYEGRDDFNNLALRAFSVLGLATVLSGFVLFVLTSRPVLARRHNSAVAALSSR